MEDLSLAVNDYLQTYNVDDVYYEATELLFILESPHTQEIKHGYPVAGSSGVEMTKFIYGADRDDAFGKLVANKDKYQASYNSIEKFGLLNVSPAPMQQQALADQELTRLDQEVVEVLEKLRVNYQAKKHRKESWNLVKQIILANFKTRLVSALEATQQLKYLVPCGRFAASYLDLVKEQVNLIEETEIITDIPHPSFNQWQSYETMQKLERKLPEIF
ncbi:hypothetical protein [Halanaerobaculum tunisiense]